VCNYGKKFGALFLLHEEKTSAFISTQLKAMGYTVMEHVGQFLNRSRKSYRVIAMTLQPRSFLLIEFQEVSPKST